MKFKHTTVTDDNQKYFKLKIFYDIIIIMI